MSPMHVHGYANNTPSGDTDQHLISSFFTPLSGSFCGLVNMACSYRGWKQG